MCVPVVLCVVLVVCVLFCCGGACVWCVVKLGTLSLSCSLSFLFSFPFAFPFFFSFSFFSLLFFFLSCSFSCSCSCSCSISFPSLSLLFSPPNIMERTDQPTRRPTSRHLNVIWRRASAQQSVLSPPPLPSLLPSPPPLLLKKEETFYYRNISGEEIIFITVLNKFQKIAAGENYSCKRWYLFTSVKNKVYLV